MKEQERKKRTTLLAGDTINFRKQGATVGFFRRGDRLVFDDPIDDRIVLLLPQGQEITVQLATEITRLIAEACGLGYKELKSDGGFINFVFESIPDARTGKPQVRRQQKPNQIS